MFSNQVEFIPFKAFHAFQMDWIDKNDFLNTYTSPQAFEILEAQGNTRTFVQGESILGLLSITAIHPNHVHIAMAMGRSIQKEFNVNIYKAMKSVINNLSKTYLRVSAEGKIENYKLNKLMKRLGFKVEGIMKKWGPGGEDYFLWAITREE